MSWAEKYVTADSDGGDGSSGNPWTLAEAIAGAAAGDRINVKAGTYAHTTSDITFAAEGTTTAPIWWRGYKTDIGDQDANATAVAGTDVPLLTFSTGQMIVTGAFNIFSNFAITSECVAVGGAVYVQDTGVCMYRVNVANSAAHANASAVRTLSKATYFSATACKLSATTTAARCFYGGATGADLEGCSFHGGVIGVNVSYGFVAYCIFDSQAGDALELNIRAGAVNCSIYSPAGNGITTTGTLQAILIANCYFESVDEAGKAAIANTTGIDSALVRCIGNAFYDCTANYSGITESFAIFDGGTLASAAMTNPGSGDYTVDASVAAVAFPGAMENLASSIGYSCVGALQPEGEAADYPAEADVQSGVSFGSGVYTGTFTAPAVADVQASVQYGGGGTEYEGTFAVPSVGDVADGVTYGAGGTEFTGTLEISGLSETQMEAILDARGLTEPASDTADSVARRGASAVTLSDVGSGGGAIHSTTIATLASQTSFTLTAGSADDDAYNYCVVVVTDESTATQKCVGVISDYTGSSKTVTLGADPAIFTMAVGDTVEIYPPVGLRWINGTVASGAATVDANMVAVSDDETAADTLELFVEALDQATGQLDSGSLAAGTIAADTFAADVDDEVRAWIVDNSTGDGVRIDSAALNTCTGVTIPAIKDTVDSLSSGVTVSDKTGFKLASDGLDAIATTAPSGPATTFREMVVQTWRRFFRKATKTSTAITTYADDGTTVITTQAIGSVGSNEEQGAAT